MIKRELDHVFRKLENGQTDYHSQMVEFDYSHFNEERREVVINTYTYSGDSYSKTYVTFGRGLTLETYSNYIGDGDSVWGAVVWDPITKQPEHFGFGYEGSLSKGQELVIDATDEVKAEYKAWKDEQEKKRQEYQRQRDAQRKKEQDEREAATPRRGKVVRVVRGRKVPIGTFGKVFWYGDTQYGFRVGIEIKDFNGNITKQFTAVQNVEVVKDNLQLVEDLAKEKGLI